MVQCRARPHDERKAVDHRTLAHATNPSVAHKQACSEHGDKLHSSLFLGGATTHVGLTFEHEDLRLGSEVGQAPNDLSVS